MIMNNLENSNRLIYISVENTYVVVKKRPDNLSQILVNFFNGNTVTCRNNDHKQFLKMLK